MLTGVVVHVLEHVRDRRLTLGVDTTSELTNEANLLVSTKPVGSCNKTLRANGSRNAVGRCTGAIALGKRSAEIHTDFTWRAGSAYVEVLMHLVHEFVLWIGK
jgi:hypothetical protein